MAISLIVAIIGVIVYIMGAVADHPAFVRACDLGRYAFLAGLLAYLLK